VGAVRPGESGPIISLPQTGQTICYDSNGTVISCAGTGQDGEFQAGVAWPNPRFTDNQDQTVNDNLTGLMWTKDGNAPGPEACGPGAAKTWQEALDYVKCLNTNNYLGYNDWRLPNVVELASLVQNEEPNLADWLNSQGFTNVQPVNYWTSTTAEANGANTDAFFVNFFNRHTAGSGLGGHGAIFRYNKDANHYNARAVRSGQIWFTLTYNAGPNGSITGDTIQKIEPGLDGIEVGAVPKTGYHFVRWSDGLQTPTRTDTGVTGNISVTAEFAVNTYNLTYTAGSNGTLTGETTQNVAYNSSGTGITAMPDDGYHFVQWSDGKNDNPRTEINVTSDITVTAEFAINRYTVSYSSGDNGFTYGPLPRIIDHGSPYEGSVLAVPKEGYRFVQWSDSVTDNPRTDGLITGDIIVTAEFALIQHDLSYYAANGSIIGDTPQIIDYGSNGTPVRAVPDTGYYFTQWSDGITDNPRTDSNVMGNISVSAIMMPICINWDIDGDGTIGLADIIHYLQVLSGQRGTMP